MNWTEKYSRICDLVRVADGSRSGADMAQAMEDAGWILSRRQIERDIAELRQIGIDIWFDGDKQRYTVTVTEYHRPLGYVRPQCLKAA